MPRAGQTIFGYFHYEREPLLIVSDAVLTGHLDWGMALIESRGIDRPIEYISHDLSLPRLISPRKSSAHGNKVDKLLL